MTIENRFALVTVRIPLSDFTTEDEMNVWSPSDWPEVIANGAATYMEGQEYEVHHSVMEGEVYQEKEKIFYCVWNVMGNMIAQYLTFSSDPPTIKEIQDQVDALGIAVMKTYQAAGQEMKEPPTDIVLFYFNRVAGRIEDGAPRQVESRDEGEAETADGVEVEKGDNGNTVGGEFGNYLYN